MDREEPKFTETDLSDVEFRPRSYRGPSRRERHSSSDGFAWKIGVSVGIAVLAALLIFNAYERHQARKDAEEAMLILKKELAAAERESVQALAAMSRQYAAPAPATPILMPIPPGFRCANGILLKREANGWTQITHRSRQIYCPEGGGVAACYPVTPQSVGCNTR